MLRKFLETKSNGSPKAVQIPAPRPGDYDLGSLGSRAAARILLKGEDKPLFIVWPSQIPSWIPAAEPLRIRIQKAGGGGVMMVSTDDLNDPDLPANIRLFLTRAGRQQQERRLC